MSWLLHQTACGHCLLRTMSRRHGNFRRKVWKSGDPRFTLVMCNSWTCMVQYMWRLFYQKGRCIRSSMQEAQRCQAHHPQPLAGRHSPVQFRGLARSEMEMSVTILSSGLPLTPFPKRDVTPSPCSRSRKGCLVPLPHHAWDACTPFEERDDIHYTTSTWPKMLGRLPNAQTKGRSGRHSRVQLTVARLVDPGAEFAVSWHYICPMGSY